MNRTVKTYGTRRENMWFILSNFQNRLSESGEKLFLWISMKYYLQNLKQSQVIFGDFLYSVIQAAIGKKKIHGLY